MMREDPIPLWKALVGSSIIATVTLGTIWLFGADDLDRSPAGLVGIWLGAFGLMLAVTLLPPAVEARRWTRTLAVVTVVGMLWLAGMYADTWLAVVGLVPGVATSSPVRP